MLTILAVMAKPVTDPRSEATLRDALRVNPHFASLTLAAAARQLADDAKAAGHLWMAAEAWLVVDADRPTARLALQRQMDTNVSVRELPVEPLAAVAPLDVLSRILVEFETETGLEANRERSLEERLYAVVDQYKMLANDVIADASILQDLDKGDDDVMRLKIDNRRLSARLAELYHGVGLLDVVKTDAPPELIEALRRTEAQFERNAPPDPVYALAEQVRAEWMKTGEPTSPEFTTGLRQLLDEILSPAAALQEKKPQWTTKVKTYTPDTGHGPPTVPVKIVGGQGVGLTLPRGGEETSDVYVERYPEGWTVNVGPDGQDIEVAVRIHDNGGYVVRGKADELLAGSGPSVLAAAYSTAKSAVDAVAHIAQKHAITSPRYVISDKWEHLDGNDQPYWLRWVYDRQVPVFVAIQACYNQAAGFWKPLDPVRDLNDWRDVTEHLLVANDIVWDTEQWEDVRVDDALPGWLSEGRHEVRPDEGKADAAASPPTDPGV